MDKRFLLTVIKIWWIGFKVLCRWCAFGIVLFVLWLPSMGLTGLVGKYTGYILGVATFIIIVPIIFFLTSRYLLLLGDERKYIPESDGDSTGVAGKPGRGIGRMVQFMKPTTLFIVLLIFSVAAAIITPPDVVSQVFVIVEMAIIYGLLVFIISRFKSFVQTPISIRKLIVVLVCLLSVTISYSITLYQYYYMRVERSENATSVNSPEAAPSGSSTDTNSPINATDTMVGEK